MAEDGEEVALETGSSLRVILTEAITNTIVTLFLNNNILNDQRDV